MAVVIVKGRGKTVESLQYFSKGRAPFSESIEYQVNELAESSHKSRETSPAYLFSIQDFVLVNKIEQSNCLPRRNNSRVTPEPSPRLFRFFDL